VVNFELKHRQLLGHLKIIESRQVNLGGVEGDTRTHCCQPQGRSCPSLIAPALPKKKKEIEIEIEMEMEIEK